MHKCEQEIIALIERNPYLSDDLKKRYILALFLMDSVHQEEYLELWKAFDARSKKIESGNFKLENGDDLRGILRSVDEVKRDLIQKIKSTNQN